MLECSIRKRLWSGAGEMQLQVDLRLESEGFYTLYGPSGAGKTSLLRIIAGLLIPDNGRLVINGNIWLDTNAGINLKPQNRRVGFLFQDYALFPNMTVQENLCFALTKGQDQKLVSALIEIMELGGLQSRKPATLSGGQQQRVALARALVRKPDILLLDEPLSALDQAMRRKLQQYLRQVHQDYGLTTVLISHDISEIFKLSDQVLVIKQGQIVQQGKPIDIFAHRAVSGKFQFIGEVIAIERQEFIFIIAILIGKELVRVVADETEATTLTIGDKVLVASKAFNPVIKKIS